MVDRLRPNVVLICAVVAALTGVFGVMLIQGDAPIAEGLLGTLFGIGMGGLIGIAGGIAAPPTVPAELMAQVLEGRCAECPHNPE